MTGALLHGPGKKTQAPGKKEIQDFSLTSYKGLIRLYYNTDSHEKFMDREWRVNNPERTSGQRGYLFSALFYLYFALHCRINGQLFWPSRTEGFQVQLVDMSLGKGTSTFTPYLHGNLQDQDSAELFHPTPSDISKQWVLSNCCCR